MALQKFIEEVEIHSPQMFTESEDSEAKQSGKWTATVWKLDKVNRNGRIYSTELAQRLVSENKVTTANDGHWSDSMGDYSVARAVCKNARIEGEELVVDIEFIDEDYEKKLLVLIEKGVKIGVSSVGWGETDEYGRIQTNSYELIRWLDFVTVPAGDVYANHTENTKPKNAQEESVDSNPGSEMSEADYKLADNISNIFLRRR